MHARTFGLAISLRKTQVMEHPPTSQTTELEAVHEFVYLGSTIPDSLSLETEISRRVGNATTTLSRQTKRVWSNSKLAEHSKVPEYKACVLSTLRQ